MTEFSKSPPMPASLRDEIATHSSAADLERVWHLLDRADGRRDADAPSPTTGERSADALWDRIAAATGIPLATADDAAARSAPTAPPALTLVVSDAYASTAARRVWRRPGASVLLAAAASVAVMTWWGTGNVRVTTPAGRVETVRLRDGSTVVLNGASALQHPRYFRPTWLGGDGRRAVRVQGEAYFRVAKGQTPFVVQTAQAEIRVVGTRFNVQARATDAAAHTDVAVEEGVVQVRALGALAAVDRSVELRANDRVSVRGVADGAASREDDVLQVTQGDPRRDLAWTNGGFAAVDQPLREILASLEAQFGVELSMRDSVAAASVITLYYPERTTIDRILTDLATARGWAMRRTSRGYELRAAP